MYEKNVLSERIKIDIKGHKYIQYQLKLQPPVVHLVK